VSGCFLFSTSAGSGPFPYETRVLARRIRVGPTLNTPGGTFTNVFTSNKAGTNTFVDNR
jgi:hypothetical protein